MIVIFEGCYPTRGVDSVMRARLGKLVGHGEHVSRGGPAMEVRSEADYAGLGRIQTGSARNPRRSRRFRSESLRIRLCTIEIPTGSGM